MKIFSQIWFWLTSRVNRLVVDIVLIILPIYIATRPFMRERVSQKWSVRGLFDTVFQNDIATIVFVIGIAYIVVSKVIILIRERQITPAIRDDSICRKQIVKLLIAQNQQIEGMLNDHKPFMACFLEMLNDRDGNIHLVLEGINEFMAESMRADGIDKSEIHLSFMEIVDSAGGKRLVVVRYIDGRGYDVSEPSISVNEGLVNNYACCRVASSGKTELLQSVTAKNFFIGDNVRRMTVKHYIGLPVSVKRDTVGVINIEFHKKVFSSRAAMKKFVEGYLFPFRSLLQYQCQRKMVASLLEGGK